MDNVAPAPSRLPQLSPRAALLGVVALAVLAAAGLVYRQRSAAPSSGPHYLTAAAQRGDISSGVQETGPIAAATAVPLHFKTSGKVMEIDVKAGDRVAAGQVLGKLEPADLQAQQRQAQANRDAAQAAYDKVAQGTQPVDVAVAQSAVDATNRQLSDARGGLAAVQGLAAKDAAANQRALDNARKNLAAVRTQADAAVRSDRAAVQGAQLAVADAQRQQTAAAPVLSQQVATAKARLFADQTTTDAQVGRGQATKEQRQSALDVDQTGIDVAVAQASQQIVQAQAAVNQAQTALSNANAAVDSDLAKIQAQLTSAQAQVDAAQDAANTSEARNAQAAQAAQAQLNTAISALQTARASYDKAVSPPTQADLDNARAQLAAQQALLDLAQSNLDSATLVAPSAGVITAVNGAVGQWLIGGSTSGAAASAASGANNSSANSTNSGTNFISLTDLNGLQVQAQVNEADVSRVKAGQSAKFTVDAYPGQTLDGKVAVVQPLGSSNQNVVTYTVTIDINPTPAQLLPGMTASVTILTTDVRDVLLIPSAAVSFAQSLASASASPSASAAGLRGDVIVIVVSRDAGAPRQIKTGASDDHSVEVLSGLSPGDQVATGLAQPGPSSK